METIFIQIASYCDPELVPTIQSCLANAEYPNRLRFGICWQHADDDHELNPLIANDNRFSVLNVQAKESKGACWARNLIQENLYKEEDYTLQIDSHMRFSKHWDTKLIDMVKQLQQQGFNKPLITTYTASYDPNNDPGGRVVKDVWKMNFDRFTPEGIVLFLPASMTEEERKQPIPARFYSGHFAFTLGKFCVEVPHDPEFYFIGEEISISARAYTNGYDLFHPPETIIWHEYTRKNRVKQWDVVKDWWKADQESNKAFRAMFDNMITGKYKLGTERTLDQYKQYSGVDLVNRTVQEYTLGHFNPPNPIAEPFVGVFRHCINLYPSQFPHSDYTFLAVIFQDEYGNDMHREDCFGDELKEFTKLITTGEKELHLWRKFYTNKFPHKWIVWPYSEQHGWCDKIETTMKVL